MFCEKGFLRSFVKFAGKHLGHSLFFNKVVGIRPATLLKNKLWHRYFPVNFAKFLRTLFLQNTSGGCFCWLLVMIYDGTIITTANDLWLYILTRFPTIRNSHVLRNKCQVNYILIIRLTFIPQDVTISDCWKSFVSKYIITNHLLLLNGFSYQLRYMLQHYWKL